MEQDQRPRELHPQGGEGLRREDLQESRGSEDTGENPPQETRRWRMMQ